MRKPQELTVLVVDDDPDLREMMTLIFSQKQFNVLSAENGADALGLVREHRIDAVVTDVCMPIVNGKELLASIRKEFASLPVVLLVSGFSDLTVGDALLLGAAGFIAKPFSETFLVQSVLDAVNQVEAKPSSS